MGATAESPLTERCQPAPTEPYALWHLFPVEEMRKLEAFVHGGLWCAELNSIVSFEGDTEGSQPFGFFVSCWHRSKSDPTPVAWEVFGGLGNGIALRAQPSFLKSLAKRFSADGLRVRFDEVRYLPKGEQCSDAAFEVACSHAGEREMRLGISVVDTPDTDDAKRKEHIRKSVPAVCLNPRAVTKFQQVTFVECDGAEAIVLPVPPGDLIMEILAGPRVRECAKNELARMLERSELGSKIRG